MNKADGQDTADRLSTIVANSLDTQAKTQDLARQAYQSRTQLHRLFLRKLKAIAKKAGVEGAELHRFRKTYADTLHEEGVSVNTIRIRLGHESLDVTLAYLKGKDAESEEAQEHANSSSLALYA
jgi:integrase